MYSAISSLPINTYRFTQDMDVFGVFKIIVAFFISLAYYEAAWK